MKIRSSDDRRWSQKSRSKRNSCSFTALLVVLISVFFIGSLAMSIVIDSMTKNVVHADVAIVLGAAVWNDQPSPVFEERIKHAINLYNQGYVTTLIFTGGVGEGDSLAESESARIYAIERGVRPKDIFIEKDSRVTEQNLIGACKIMKELGVRRAMIVSDPLHMRRSVVMATSMGIEAYHSPTPTTRYRTWRSKIPSLLYEVFFYGAYIVKRAFGQNPACQI